MAVVETEQQGATLIVTLNRPERMNALGRELRAGMAEAFTELRDNKDLEIGILTGTGKAFCAGEDMKEAIEAGQAGLSGEVPEDPFWTGKLDKPVIGAINGYAMGGGFMLVERTDLRVAVKGALFEISEAKRWLLGGYNHGLLANLPHPIATEMALGFRITAERFYELGFINRLVESEELLPTAIEMAEHMLTLPPAARVNTIYMMRQMQPNVETDLARLANALRNHGDKSDLMESRRAFAEKRKPNFSGWLDPDDRYHMPTLESVRSSAQKQTEE
ncbi:MAG: enoyl-CoA hydratase-related protein [Pseudomonadota bacterium]